MNYNKKKIKRSQRDFIRDFHTSATCLYQLNFCICFNANELITWD